MTTFTDLGLSQSLIQSLSKAGFETATPIQEQAIPPQLEGKDILGIAQTGSGKTAAFGLPILMAIAKMEGRIEPRSTRALILAPTRELAVQIEESLRKFAGPMRLSTVLLLGGMSRHHQVQKLARGVDITVATPGRLKDLLDDKCLRLDLTKFLVLDEADRMLDMGFIKPVRAIAAAMGTRRQTALFSATMAPEIAELAAGLLRNPVRVEVAPPATTVGTIEQSVILVGRNDKRAKMNELLKDPALSKVIVFSRTKHGADRIAKNLAMDGHSVAAIHGDKRQNARQAALKGFTDGKVRLLVATDIAARGIDVPNISHVINFELPDAADNYVHRIGRTGRNGASGIAITLCSEGEFEQLRDVEKLIRRSLPKTGYVNGIEKLDAPAPRQSNGRRPGAGQNTRGGQPRAPRQAEAPRHPGDAQRTRPAQPQTPSRSPADVQRPGNAVPGGARPQAKAWWEKDTGSATPKADKPKQRWSGKPRGDKPGGQRRERVAG